MTELQDGIAELLADPLCDTTHRKLVDRVCEECTDPRRALLDLVIAHKGSDGPRLAYAVFCETHGEPDRAEFIRVQCELVRTGCARPRYREIFNPDVYGNSPVDRIFEGFCGKCPECRRRDGLLGRGGELVRCHGYGWAAGLVGESETRGMGIPGAYAVMVDYLFPNGTGTNTMWLTFGRGFVERIECPANCWLAHADVILSKQPVASVKLLTAPDYVVRYDPPNKLAYATVAGQTVCVSEEELAVHRLGASGRETLLLSKRFPGVTFELPRRAPGDHTGTPGAVGWDNIAEWPMMTPAFEAQLQQNQPLPPDPRLAELDGQIAELERQYENAVRYVATVEPEPEIVRNLRNTLAEMRRFRERAGRDHSVFFGVSDTRAAFDAWRAMRRG